MASDIERLLPINHHDTSGRTGRKEVEAGLAAPLTYSIIAGIGAFSFGFALGYTGPIKDHLKNDLKLNDDENSLFSSIVNVGAMIGALLGGVLTQAIGRKMTIMTACLPFIGGFALLATAKILAELVVSRLLIGIGVGLVSLAVPVYIAEIAPPSLRGGLGSINQLAITIGVLVAYVIGIVVSWRLLAWIGAMCAGGLLVASLILPESPRYLYSKNKHEKARAALKRLRAAEYDTEREMDEIKAAAMQSEQDSGASIADLFAGTTRRAMIVAACFMLFQQFSGINAVIFFVGNIFEDAGFSNGDLASIIFGLVQVVVTAVSCLLVDKTGRRVLVMAAGSGMSASCCLLGFFFFQKDHTHDPPGTLALVSALVYIACFSIGLGAIPWVIMSEIFPSKVRGLAASIATLINWTSSFVVVQTFQNMNSTFTEAGTFFFYAAVCAIGVYYVRFSVPETKGRTLEEIESYFTGTAKSGMFEDRDGNKLASLFVYMSLFFLGLMLVWGSTS